MRRLLAFVLLLSATAIAGATDAPSAKLASVPTTPAPALPAKAEVLAKMRLANGWFMKAWPDPAKPIVTRRARPSNIWTRGVYYEGLMALHAVAPDAASLDYAVRWGEAHQWGLRHGTTTRNADDQCCGQTYIELYQLDPKPERLRDIVANIDFIVAGERNDDWWWIDAIQMAMPVYAKLGVLKQDPRYWEKAHAIYTYTKNQHGGKGLYNPADKLWWRDKDFVPPYREPNGEDCYWSRGNGWVIAAMARVLDVLPANAPHRAEYETMLRDMAEALVPLQRADGFWNCSLHDPDNFGGKESSGTALFVYAMAWGVRHGVLPAEKYLPVITKAWQGLVNDAVHPDGFLGYIQGTGKEPKDGQPTKYDSKPDFEDFGVGCFLLAGAEVYQLAR
ncbi:glycoside hydrolase family 88 protein [Opitutus sp. ER46]|uniref:glycoside hydrolase family 88/105 protein n=1 Tax=Opitutus sp. ER46 TaxID=2161864 RepID=UPI000D317311|nr:glycoside hydrolase family 88 protein [Opitutus sp. ER46]PTX97898.1 family 88 glycosyl hydrolase [Opitutus sp. ER46]